VEECPGGFDFSNPDFMMTFRMADVDIGPSRFYCSLNRGKSWQGPFQGSFLRLKRNCRPHGLPRQWPIRLHRVSDRGKIEWT